MTCRSCGGETGVDRTMKTPRQDVRRRRCFVCGDTWETTEREVTGSRKRALGSQGSAPVDISSSLIAGQTKPNGHQSPDAPASDGVSKSSLPLSDPDQTGARSMENDEGKPWTGWQWRVKFASAWCARYGRLAYGGGDADAKATGDMSDQLAAMPEAERVAAQGRAGEMFAEYLSDESPGTSKARHPWSWFVQRFQGLVVPQRRAAVRSQWREIA